VSGPRAERGAGTNRAGGGRSAASARVCLWIVALSVAIRLLAWAALPGSDAVPQFDEQGYLHRGEGFAAIARSLAAARAPEPADLAEAYGGGTWPPLNSMLIGLALLLGGGVPGARLVELLLSAATTGGLFLLAERSVGRRAAVGTATAHALLPSFVHYAPLLLSESAYLLLLVALMLKAARLLAEDEPRPFAGAALVGLLGGLAMLTRAVALPAFAVVVALIALAPRGRPKRPLAALVAVAVAVAVVAPWQVALAHREGRLAILSTATELNLLVANNPWQRESGDRTLPFLDHQVREEARRTGRRPDQVARRIALAEIVHEPGKTISNAWLQARRLLGPDRVALRSLQTAYYRPLPDWATRSLTIVFLLTVPLLFGGAAAAIAAGAVPARFALLLGSVAAAHLLPPLFAVSVSRLGIPALLLLLPLAAASFAERPGRVPRGAVVVGTGIACAVALATWTLGPRSLPRWESSAFAPQPSAWERRLVPSERGSFDAVDLDRSAAPATDLVVELATPGYRFADGRASLSWPAGDPRARLRVELRGDSLGLPPPLLSIRSPDGRIEASIAPVNPELWWTWRQLDGAPVRVRWRGGERVRGVARGLEPFRPAEAGPS